MFCSVRAVAAAQLRLPSLGVAAARVALAGGRSLLHETSLCVALGVTFGHFFYQSMRKKLIRARHFTKIVWRG